MARTGIKREIGSGARGWCGVRPHRTGDGFDRRRPLAYRTVHSGGGRRAGTEHCPARVIAQGGGSTLEGFRFTMPYTVRVSDINYAGHVSNAAVLQYFQEARIAYLRQLGPFTELDIGEGCGIIMPEARVLYRAEMLLGEVLVLGARVEEVGSTSFRMGYRVERGAQVTAEGTTPIIAFDYAARRPRRVPQGLREALVRFENLPVQA
jgi:YbgC/YbaW family acyl-CoA thioester hydrolase